MLGLVGTRLTAEFCFCQSVRPCRITFLKFLRNKLSNRAYISERRAVSGIRGGGPIGMNRMFADASTCIAIRRQILMIAALGGLFSAGAQAQVASVYGGADGLCGTRTANGERLDCKAMTAAHRTLPFGTRLRVCYQGCVVVRINDRGPFTHGRHIDLTPAAARAIGLTDVGRVSIIRDIDPPGASTSLAVAAPAGDQAKRPKMAERPVF
jgi:rare lipoprotein A